MAKMPVDIGFAKFNTKTEAKEHFKEMLNKYEVGQLVNDAEAVQLACLLEQHPDAYDKIGSGLSVFRVGNAIYGTKCFEIVRADGSSTDFSYIACIDGRPSPFQEAVSAMRHEVQGDIMDAKRRYFAKYADNDGRVVCPLSGDKITLEEAHADHAPPHLFAVLAKLFLAVHKIVPDRNTVTPPADNQYVPRLTDRQLADEWRSFHHEQANIRAVKALANLRNSAASKIRKKDRQLKLV
jgi:hypothetical protein